MPAAIQPINSIMMLFHIKITLASISNHFWLSLLCYHRWEREREKERDGGKRDTHLIDFSAGKQQETKINHKREKKKKKKKKKKRNERKKSPPAQHLVNAAVIAFFFFFFFQFDNEERNC